MIMLVCLSHSVKALMMDQPVDVSFRNGIAEVPPGTVKILRKGSKMEILEF